MSQKSKKLLVIGHVWPEPLATAAGIRMLQLLHFWKDWGAEIFFASAAAKTEYSFDLGKMEIEEIPISLNDSAFDRMISKLDPDIVMFDRFMTEEQYGWRVLEQLPNSIRILNTEDLHSLRRVRKTQLDLPTPELAKKWLQADITKRELASIYRSDLSLIISSFEEHWLKKHAVIPVELLAYAPFMYDTSKMTVLDLSPGFGGRKDFIFTGNGKHQPNLDAIHWLKNEIWPGIRNKLPEVNLHIYGAYLPKNIIDFHDPSTGFLIHGWVDDIRAVLVNSRVNLAPLRYGAGLKGKLLEAMICGTPSMATHIGMEGILEEDNDSKTGLMAKKNFVEQAFRLYSEKQLWESQRSADRKTIDKHFSRRAHYAGLKDRIAYLEQNLTELRQQNVVGGILWHQTLNSTKYMAKWIEAKNNTQEIRSS